MNSSCHTCLLVVLFSFSRGHKYKFYKNNDAERYLNEHCSLMLWEGRDRNRTPLCSSVIKPNDLMYVWDITKITSS